VTAPSVLGPAHPLTPDRFADLEAVFAGKGCSFARGCWCMEYREPSRPAAAGTILAALRKERLRALAAERPPPGLIGYDAEGRPVGWVAVGPRGGFARLRRSRAMAAVDDRPVWSVICFVVPSPHRGRGVASALLDQAISYARGAGATLLEAYPIDKAERSQPQWMWHGARSMFERAGFREVARRTPQRPVMRLDLTDAA
jgi:GNAT superfamily N-acetyltransferase